MVTTIAPVVYGRRRDYLLAIGLHVVGATVTAALTGAVLGLIGALFDAPWGETGLWVVVAIAVVYAVREVTGLPIPLPNARRQVPEWWRTFFSPPVAATLYGAGLGVAFFTFLSFGTFVAVAAAALAGGDPMWGAAIAAPFGLARGIAVAVVGGRSQEPGETVAAVARVGGTWIPRSVNAAALLLVAGTVAFA